MSPTASPIAPRKDGGHRLAISGGHVCWASLTAASCWLASDGRLVDVEPVLTLADAQRIKLTKLTVAQSSFQLNAAVALKLQLQSASVFFNNKFIKMITKYENLRIFWWGGGRTGRL